MCHRWLERAGKVPTDQGEEENDRRRVSPRSSDASSSSAAGARLGVPSGGVRQLDGQGLHGYEPRQRRSGRHGRLGVRDLSSTASESTPSAPAAGGHPATTTMVMAKTVGGIGNVVTDDKGMTLYRYDRDEANPSKWTCAGECMKTWIPCLLSRTPYRPWASRRAWLGTVHRNGRKQLTLGGWPLYRYVGDTQAGQTNGQAKDKTGTPSPRPARSPPARAEPGHTTVALPRGGRGSTFRRTASSARSSRRRPRCRGVRGPPAPALLELSRCVNVRTAKAGRASSVCTVTVLSTASADEIACPDRLHSDGSADSPSRRRRGSVIDGLGFGPAPDPTPGAHTVFDPHRSIRTPTSA